MARPKIIQAPSEDPREVAIRSLQAVLDHDPNMTNEDQVFCNCAIRSCRYSLRMDMEKEAQAGIGAVKGVAYAG